MSDMRVRWLEGASPAPLSVTQVFGFCFDSDGRILLIEHAGQFGVPGGKPEKYERYEETLRREVRQEAQATLGEIGFLGYQRVEGDLSLMDDAPYAQVQAIARLAQLLPPARDPATRLTYQRALRLPTAVPDLLQRSWIKRSGRFTTSLYAVLRDTHEVNGSYCHRRVAGVSEHRPPRASDGRRCRRAEWVCLGLGDA